MLGLNIFGLLYGDGRAPVIAFFMTIFFLVIFYLNTKIKTNQVKIIKAVGASILIVIILFLFLPKLFSTLFYRINLLLTQKMGASVMVRLNLYNSAIKAIYRKPIQGLGMGGFSVYYKGRDQRLYPHNILLEIGAEMGIIGLIPFFFLVGFCLFYLLKLRKIHKKTEKYYLITMILALFIFMFLNTLVSGDINDNRLFFVWLGFVYSIGIILRKERFVLVEAEKHAQKNTLKNIYEKSLPHHNGSSFF